MGSHTGLIATRHFFFFLWHQDVHRANLWEELLFKRMGICLPSTNFMMVHTQGISQANLASNLASRPRASAEAGLVDALKELERTATAGLLDS